ncbi:MAG: diguanylate cyclase domain-containing protein [Cyanobacteriota bacterium]
MLQAIASRLQNQLRSSSLNYRYGGEEFVCITLGLNPSRSYRYANFLH